MIESRSIQMLYFGDEIEQFNVVQTPENVSKSSILAVHLSRDLLSQNMFQKISVCPIRPSECSNFELVSAQPHQRLE